MADKKKTTVKFETKLFKQKIRTAEKDTLRRLLASDAPEDETAFEHEEELPVEQLVDQGVKKASGTQAHPHSS